jgi:hypothetical protein
MENKMFAAAALRCDAVLSRKAMTGVQNRTSLRWRLSARKVFYLDISWEGFLPGGGSAGGSLLLRCTAVL